MRIFAHNPALWFAMLGLLATATTGMAAQEKPRPVRLPPSDSAQLSRIVCGTELNAPENKIMAWMERGGRAGRPPMGPGGPNKPPANSPELQADIECKPHQANDKFAVYHTAHCVRAADWQCGRRATLIRTTLEQKPLTINTNGYQAEIAVSLVNRLAAYRTQKGDPVLKPETTQCALIKGPDKDSLDVNCEGRVFRLSYWCPKSSCPRIFAIDGYLVPADVGGL
ncbi:MAG: hypothetical protein QM808_08720 [Steroidobacteraceae bacterium]